MEWIGKYAAEQRPDVIIHLGDHWDMPSLSTYEKKGSKYFHGKSYQADVMAGNEAMATLTDTIQKEVKRSARRKSEEDWKPELHLLRGNHEYRIQRAIHAEPILEGSLRDADLVAEGWRTHDFLEIVELDGILYSHFFVNQQSALRNGLTGTVDNRLNKVKQSFTAGHQQGRMYGSQFTSTGRELHGLVVGSCYLHDEDYMGPQGNHYWRGLVVKHEVNNGSYDPMFVSLDYLERKYG
jgi:hypothetical protein